MSIEERKAAYEQSALKRLMEADGHTICKRCYCCDSSFESSPCWLCGGFEDEDEEIYSVCSACGGEGKIFWEECFGRCDEQGNHKANYGAIAPGSTSPVSGRDPEESQDTER